MNFKAVVIRTVDCQTAGITGLVNLFSSAAANQFIAIISFNRIGIASFRNRIIRTGKITGQGRTVRSTIAILNVIAVHHPASAYRQFGVVSVVVSGHSRVKHVVIVIVGNNNQVVGAFQTSAGY